MKSIKSGRVVMLDFDGVLLPAGTSEPRPVIGHAVACLNLVLAMAKADIVVSSNWRKGRSVEQLEQLLRSWGVHGGKILDKTGTSPSDDRGAEIKKWLEENGPVESFVVIDDDETDLVQFGERFVQTDPILGLLLATAIQAVSQLRRTEDGKAQENATRRLV